MKRHLLGWRSGTTGGGSGRREDARRDDGRRKRPQRGDRERAVERLEARWLMAANFVINEFLASNQAGIKDQDGDSSDWIEIYNSGDTAGSLNNWSLVDSVDKWVFPNMSLAAGEYLVVFASGKNRRVVGSELHTNFSLNAGGERLALLRPDQSVADEFNPYPTQENNISYGRSQTVTSLVTAGANAKFRVPTVVDGSSTAWAGTGFNDASWTGTVAAPVKTLLVTELSSGSTDYFEIQNVSSQTVNTTGWTVAFNDGTTDPNINTVKPVLWNLSPSAAPGLVQYRTENGGDPNFIGTSIDWPTAGAKGWVMIVDNNGQIVDLVVFGYSSADLAGMSVVVNGFSITNSAIQAAWSGAPEAYAGTSSNSMQRQGSTDSNSGTDWSWVAATSLGSTNAGLSVPFSQSGTTPVKTGIGFNVNPSAFNVNYYKANLAVTDLATAEAVIADPAKQSAAATQTFDTINMFNTGGTGNYGGDDPFPTQSIGLDIEDFVIEATGTIIIPTAGAWTFGVNSDDGFGLQLTNGINTFDMSFPGQRGPSDSLATFSIPSPGAYQVRLVMFERGGGSGVELFAQSGSHLAFNGGFKLVGDTAGGGLPLTGFGGAIQTDVRTQLQNVNSSLRTRIPFSVANPAAFQSLTLKMKYNDGFVAYLNGQEVARRNAPGGNPAWNAAASGPRSDSDSSVFETINITQFLNLLLPGNNVLAIQGLNVNAADGTFLILPELIAVNAGNELRYFSTPSPLEPNNSGFVDLVQDTKFSVNRGFFNAPFQVSIVTETPGAQIRYTLDGTPPTETTGTVYSGPIAINKTTTLRAAAYRAGYRSSNIDTQTYLFLSDVVTQSPNGAPPPGFPASWGSNVVDYGMDPDIVNNAVWGPQMLSALQAIPSLSLVTDQANLFNPSTGIYANPGGDGAAWERPTSVELINPDGSQGFQIDAGLRIRGGFSRSTGNPKHALRLFFRSEYGDAKLNFPLFGSEGASSFDAVDLRTAQNYSWSFGGDGSNTMVEEVWNRDTMRDMGQQYTRSRWYHLYINGQYWGMYQTEERPEASFAATYDGGQPEEYDVIKVNDGYVSGPTDGDMNAWTAFYNLANQMPLLATQAERANLLRQLQGLNPDGTRNPAFPVHLDIDNMIEYLQLVMYSGDQDAPISNFLGNQSPNNWYGYRNRNGLAGWQFISHDAEHTLSHGMSSRLGPWPAGDPNGNGVTKSTPQWIHQMLMYSDEYRVRFGDVAQQNFFNGGVFTQASALARFNARTTEIQTAIIAESARWGDSKTATPLTKNNWLTATNNTRNTFGSRAGTVISQFRNARLYVTGATGAIAPLYPTLNAPTLSQFGGAVPNNYNLTISGPLGSTLYYTLDGTDPRNYGGALNPAATTYASPIVINSPRVVSVRARDVNGNWSALVQTEFYVNPLASASNLAITEVNYNPTAPTTAELLINPAFVADDFEFVELKNISDVPIELSGVNFGAGIQFTMSTSPNSVLGPGQFIVLVKNPTAFAARYGAGPVIGGTYTGSLANGGEQILLRAANNSAIDNFTYGDNDPWPGRADGQGSSMELISTTLDPALSDSWRSSSEYGGSPGAAGAGPLGTIVINEVLTHTDPPLSDAVELYNPTASPIDIGGWYLSDSSANYQKYRIPDNTVISAGGYLVFDEGDFNPTPLTPGPNHFSFNSAHGDDVYLVSATPAGKLLRFADHVEFGAAVNGESFGRWLNGGGDLYPMLSRTFGAANSGPRIGPVVITEIMYNPSPAIDDMEYIELLNTTDAAIDLTGWKFNAGVDFTFAAGSMIAPRGNLVVVRFNPNDPANASTLNSFRLKYGIDASVPLVGGYTSFTGGGVLDNGGETIRLTRPDEPPVGEPGFFPELLVDEVDYDDIAPWPTSPDGTGHALIRVSTAVYGNDPANWIGGPAQLQNNPTPNTPTNLTATAQAANRIRLAWTDASTNETGFRIERSTDGVNFTTLTTVGANTTTLDDVGVQSYITYSYRVRSVNAAVESVPSNSAATSTTLTTLVGTSNADTYHVLRVGSQLHIFENTSPVGAPTYFAELAALGTVTIDSQGGDDTLNVSAAGQPGLGANLVYTAGLGSNILHINAGTIGMAASAVGTLTTRVAGGAQFNPTTLRQAGLELLGSDAVVVVPPGGGANGLVVLGTLSIAPGARLDLNDNDVVMNYVVGSPLASLQQWIANGYGAGVPNTPQIRSSTGAALNNGTIHVAAENTGGLTSYLGQPIDNSTVIVRYTLAPAPTGTLTATAQAANRIRLAWTDNSNNETGFRIERSTDGINFTTLNTVGPNATTYDDVGVQSYRTHTYRVRAANGVVESAPSNQASASTTLTTLVGTGGADTYHVLRVGSQLHIYENTSPVGAPTYVAELAALGTVTIDSQGGDDTLNVSAAGQPSLGANLVYTAGLGANILNINAGTIGMTASAVGTLTTRVAGGAQFNPTTLRQAGLELLGSDAVVVVPPGGGANGLVVLGTLSIAPGARLDLNDNDLVVNYAAASPLAALQQWIANGYGAGVPNTPQIKSSTGAALNNGTIHVAAENTEGLTSYLGQPIDDSTVIVRYTLAPAPTGALTATAQAANRIRLSWGDNSANETGFRIERSTDGVNFTTLTTVGTNVTTYDDVGVQAYLTHTYRVRAVNGPVESAPSNQAAASTTLTTLLGTGNADTYHVLRVGSQLHIYENTAPVGAPTYFAELAAIGTVTFNTLGGDDIVSINPGASPLGVDLVVDGGADSNAVNLLGGSANVNATATGGALAVAVSGGGVFSTTELKRASVDIAGGNSKLVVAPHGGLAGLVALDALNVAPGGVLDLNDNDLVLNYSGASPTDVVQGWIVNGYLNTPGVPQIVSSLWETDKFSVAVDNATVGLTEWIGYPLVGVNQTIVKFTYFGDLNLDGQVDASDYLPVDNNFGGPASWMGGDGNLDGLVDAADYVTIDNNFGKGIASPLAATAALMPTASVVALSPAEAARWLAGDSLAEIAPAAFESGDNLAGTDLEVLDFSADDDSLTEDEWLVWTALDLGQNTSTPPHARATRDRGLLAFLSGGR